MRKNVMKMKYHWHSFQFRYNGMLLNDCLCNDLRSRLQGKVDYHERKAVSIFISI